MSTSCENCMRWWDHQHMNCMSDKMRFHVVADEDVRICMRVPQEQGSYFRENISETMKLAAPNGCIYDIGVCREMGEIVLRSGWDVFATAHCIEENDSLVFESCGNSSFQVNVFSSHGGSQKTTSCVNPPSKVAEAVPPSTSCDYNIPNGKDVPCPVHLQMPAAYDYFTCGGCHLTRAQDLKVLEMARTIKSEFPLYVAVMNKSNVNKGCFLRLPFMLVESSREEVFKATIKLEAPDSNIYNISSIQHNGDEIVLQSGWNDFVVAHRVQENDLLIFRCKRNSRLEVFILDPNGHQKNSSCFVTGDVSNTQEMSDDSVEIIDPPHTTPVDIHYVSSSDDSTIISAYTTKTCRRQKRQLGHCAKNRRMASASSPSIKSEHETDVLDNHEASMEDRMNWSPLNCKNSEGPSHPPFIISRTITLSELQEKIILEKVQAIRSEFPIYVAVMKKSNIGEKDFLMRFSMEYATKCLPSTTQALKLQLEGNRSREWHTILHVQGGNSRQRDVRRIAGGWQEFASENRLQLGDICLFELLKVTRRLKMIVHLIRKRLSHADL